MLHTNNNIIINASSSCLERDLCIGSELNGFFLVVGLIRWKCLLVCWFFGCKPTELTDT